MPDNAQGRPPKAAGRLGRLLEAIWTNTSTTQAVARRLERLIERQIMPSLDDLNSKLNDLDAAIKAAADRDAAEDANAVPQAVLDHLDSAIAAAGAIDPAPAPAPAPPAN